MYDVPIARNEKTSTIGYKFNKKKKNYSHIWFTFKRFNNINKERWPHSDYSIVRSQLLNWVNNASITSTKSGDGSKNNSIPDKEQNERNSCAIYNSCPETSNILFLVLTIETLPVCLNFLGESSNALKFTFFFLNYIKVYLILGRSPSRSVHMTGTTFCKFNKNKSIKIYYKFFRIMYKMLSI